jgi:hypothetical protein
MVEQEPRRWIRVDAGRAWEAVQDELRRVILQRLAK